MTSATFGPTSGRQFAFYDRDSSSWRMWPDTGLWGSIEFSETWPRTGCMFGGRAFELPTSAPRITGSGCSSSPHLPTPMAADGDRERNNPSQARRKSPPLSAVGHLLPTPRTTDANGAGRHGTGGQDLRTVVTETWTGESTGLQSSGGSD